MAETSKTSRREFLRGTSAVRAVGDALAAPRPELPLPSSVGVQAGSHLLSISREAMACLFEIVLDAAAYRDRTDTAIEALDLVEQLEAHLTIYRETSEVAAINRRAAIEPVGVEEGLFGLLERAVALSAATGGAFDITAGRLSKVWGFYRRQGQMPAAIEVNEALASVGWQHLQLNGEIRSVQFLRPGLELNLGAIGKGYALDRAGQSLVTGGINDFLIHGGNSSVLARGQRMKDECGSMSTDESGPPSFAWTVALRHPLKPSIRLAEFDLRDQALGTSGSGTQFFHFQGKKYGHIIDPRSGWPADNVLSATVIAPTAEKADALSTAFYVMGVEGTTAYCELHPDIAALLVTVTHDTAALDLHAINLADGRWRLLEAGGNATLATG
jgi:thiamine biosynthesis lipoprotein